MLATPKYGQFGKELYQRSTPPKATDDKPTTRTIGRAARVSAGTITPRQNASSQNATTHSIPKNVPMPLAATSHQAPGITEKVAKWKRPAAKASATAQAGNSSAPMRHSRAAGQKLSGPLSQPRMTKNESSVTRNHMRWPSMSTWSLGSSVG